jgi:fatty-acyl-CoA synthase
MPGDSCTRFYFIVPGYRDEEDKISEIIDSGGWIHTGDLGAVDDAATVPSPAHQASDDLRRREPLFP